MTKFQEDIQRGDTYYSVGPLQSYSGIETWEFTGDKYDLIRTKSNNMFMTMAEVRAFLDYMRDYDG